LPCRFRAKPRGGGKSQGLANLVDKEVNTLKARTEPTILS
jgi:hypothetical protein